MQEDIKSLIKYVIEKHYHAFEKIEYVKTFKSLKMRYDQSEDTSLSDSTIDGYVVTASLTGFLLSPEVTLFADSNMLAQVMLYIRFQSCHCDRA